MKRIVASSLVAASCLVTGAACAEVLLANHDASTIGRVSNPGTGLLPMLPVNFTSTTSFNANASAVIRFDDRNPRKISEASLLLDVAEFVGSSGVTSATFNVWGVRDGVCAETFSEALPQTFPFLIPTPAGADGPCLYDTDPARPGFEPLGSFTIAPSDVGRTVEFSSRALAQFINTDANHVLTLAITRQTLSGALTSFVSRQSKSGNPPRLSLRRAGEVRLSDFPGAPLVPPQGVWHYEGPLVIPFIEGNQVYVPDANVDMTFDVDGSLHTLSGTVGFPELPGMGLFDGLGSMSSSAPSLQIGYDYPSRFDNLDLPLDPRRRYFYFVEQAGSSLSWGPLTAAAGPSGATLFALEPDAPTVFFYTDQLLPRSPIQAVSVGIAGARAIPWRPDYEWGAEGRMSAGSLGELYLGGAIAIPTEIPGVEIDVAGDMTMHVEETSFLNGDARFIDWLGVNGDVALVAGLGPFSLEMYLGGSSTFFKSGSSGRVVFSGNLAPEDISGMPFRPKTRMRSAGYFSKNLRDCFVEMEGDVVFPNAFGKQAITGSVRVGGTGASFDGTAKFGGTKFDVHGGIFNPNGHLFALFGGSISHGFNAHIGKIKGTITASFDTRDAEAELSAKLKFCVKEPITGEEACDSISGSVSVTDSGAIRVCGKVPGFGKACDTLD